MDFRLVHSPLLGPSSWAAVASTARERGHTVWIPDLRPAVTGPPPHHERLVSTAAAVRADAPIVVVGHSGAGAYLPAIAGALPTDPVAVVFVDAVVPPCAGAHLTDPALVALLDQRTTADGLLDPWLSWWEDDVVAALLPDPDMRTHLAADQPRVPRSLYDEAVPVPPGWCAWPNAYVRLSGAYDDELTEADRRGWPTLALDATHLTTITDPASVFEAILRLLRVLGREPAG